MRVLRFFLILGILLSASFAWAGASGDGGNLKVENGKIYVLGTNGGVPYFDATNRLNTSALLGANIVMIGGGAGVAPKTIAAIGSSGNVLKSQGAATDPIFGTIDLANSATILSTSVLPLANGGTNNGTLTASNGQVAYSDTTKLVLTTGGSPNQCLKQGTPPTWGSCSTTVPLLVMSTGGEITTGTIMWMAPGTSDTTEARVQTIVANAATFANLKCVSTVAAGTSETYTVTQTDGVCTTTPLTVSTVQVCGLANTRIGCTASTSTGEVVNAGECTAWKVASSAGAVTGAVISCTVERTA